MGFVFRRLASFSSDESLNAALFLTQHSGDVGSTKVHGKLEGGLFDAEPWIGSDRLLSAS